MKTRNLSERLSPPKCPRRGKEKSFIQVRNLDIDLKSPRQSSTRTATYRLYLGSNCRTETHKRSSDLGTSLLSISEMTRRDHCGLQDVSDGSVIGLSYSFLFFFRRGLAHYSAVCSDVFLFLQGKRNASPKPVSGWSPIYANNRPHQRGWLSRRYNLSRRFKGLFSQIIPKGGAASVLGSLWG
jgi:hypothetical protein